MRAEGLPVVFGTVLGREDDLVRRANVDLLRENPYSCGITQISAENLLAADCITHKHASIWLRTGRAYLRKQDLLADDPGIQNLNASQTSEKTLQRGTRFGVFTAENGRMTSRPRRLHLCCKCHE